MTNGMPLFLSQLIESLAPTVSTRVQLMAGNAESRQRINDSAAIHGLEMLNQGFSVSQVVHGYGDVCQIVTELASELNASISAQDFHVFNRCLDEAIAGAVTAFASRRESHVAYEGTERLGVLAHELRNLLHSAVLSFDILKRGTVGMSGSTGAILARSLTGMSTLVERALAQVRLEAETSVLTKVALLELMEESQVTAAMQAEARGVHLTVDLPHIDVVVAVDRQLMTSALANLLQNAIKFTHPGGNVLLSTHIFEDRVAIEVTDQCGGLPAGMAQELFRPFRQEGEDRSGLGLGLSIAQSAVRANLGTLHVRDVPGQGCVFTIDLPRHGTRSASVADRT